VKRDHSDEKNERISRVSYCLVSLVLCIAPLLLVMTSRTLS